MWDALFTTVFGLLAALMAIDAFQKWRRNRNALFIASAVVAATPAPVFLMDWISGFSLLLLSAILRFAAARMLSRSG
ncbi:MAG: hypothetical protein PVF70_10245 [Anaerolineales bacterium]|jgi:hypothetical protein